MNGIYGSNGAMTLYFVDVNCLIAFPSPPLMTGLFLPSTALGPSTSIVSET